MAAREDQPQSVILDLHVIGPAEGSGALIESRGEFRERGIEADATTNGIDGFEATRSNKPCSGIRWHTIPHPLLHRRSEGLMQCFFSQVEVTKQADEGGKDTARLRAVDVVHHLAYVLGGCLIHHSNPSQFRVANPVVPRGRTMYKSPLKRGWLPRYN